MSLLAAKSSARLYPGWSLGVGVDGQEFLTRIRRKAWSRTRGPFTISWLRGLRICVSSTDQTLRSLFVTGYYEPNEFMLLSKILKPSMTFVDVGANLGLYTLYAARKVGPEGVVLALEPSSREFRKLCANVELNKLPNVRSLQVGASDSASEAELLVALEERAGHNTLGAFGYDTALCRKEVVRLERLDDIVRREGLQRVDVLKMDIEGAEWLALQGAAETLQRFRPALFLEFSDRMLKHQSCNSGQIWQFLADLGYRVYAFDERTGLPVPAIRKPSYDGENLVAFHPMRAELWPSGALAPSKGKNGINVSDSDPAEKSELEQISR